MLRLRLSTGWHGTPSGRHWHSHLTRLILALALWCGCGAALQTSSRHCSVRSIVSVLAVAIGDLARAVAEALAAVGSALSVFCWCHATMWECCSSISAASAASYLWLAQCS